MRISRIAAWMEVAEVFARRATCFRGNVGAIVVQNNRDIVGIGYNGPKSGDEHCRGNDCPLNESGGCTRSVHAEYNAIERALLARKSSHDLEGCDLYCTYSPCERCAQAIINSSVQRFFYRYSYRDPIGLELLNGDPVLQVFRVTPSGFIVDLNGDIVDPASL